MVKMEGPAVLDIANLFNSDWNFATGEDLGRRRPKSRSADDPACDTPVQVVASGPDVVGDPLYDALVSALFAAKKRIWVVTPYFVPDETLARALELAARRGVDVRLILPYHSNHISADLARSSYIRQIHEAGGSILLYRPGMIHAKMLIIDDELAVIGTANMDMRSLFLNYEVALFLYSVEQVQATARWAESLMTECRRGLPRPTWAREVAEDVGRLLSPLL
jgi:cardiolipin synthase